MNWTTFTRRTDDPKLAYIERLLDELGIPHRRNGSSFHAPILQVPEDRLDQAWDLLSLQLEVRSGELKRLDDIADDDPMFQED